MLLYFSSSAFLSPSAYVSSSLSTVFPTAAEFMPEVRDFVFPFLTQFVGFVGPAVLFYLLLKRL